MRTDLDFAPIWRSRVGFDRFFNLLINAPRLHAVDSWPPYDIIKTCDNDYPIEMAVAGFGEGDLDINQERNVLITKGHKSETKGGEYLYCGVAGRGFERNFELADHVRVEDASLSNGLVRVSLKREVPEAIKPRKIAIGEPRFKMSRFSWKPIAESSDRVISATSRAEPFAVEVRKRRDLKREGSVREAFSDLLRKIQNTSP